MTSSQEGCLEAMISLINLYINPKCIYEKMFKDIINQNSELNKKIEHTIISSGYNFNINYYKACAWLRHTIKAGHFESYVIKIKIS